MSDPWPRRPVFRAVLGLLMVWLALAATAAQAAEKVLGAYDTRLGPVQVVTGGPQHRLMVFKGKVVYTGTDFMKVAKVFRLKNYDAVLVQDFTGPLACPPQYFFLTLQGGGPVLSETFGHCSGQPKIEVDGQKIRIHFAPFGALAAAGWVFDGSKLEPGPPLETADQAAPQKE